MGLNVMNLIRSIPPQTMPMLLIGIDLIAAAMYFATHDIKRGVYWISAAVLTATVTF